MDPAEVRRKNMHSADSRTATTVVTGLTYDSGDYPAALEKALDHVDYADLRREQAGARSRAATSASASRTYVEICGLGPSQVAGAVGFQGGLWESAIVRVHPTGKVHVFIGASPHGQGEETTFAQIVAERARRRRRRRRRSSTATPTRRRWAGAPTAAARRRSAARRSMLAARKVKEKAKVVAAHLLEAAVEDMEYADGKFFVQGLARAGRRRFRTSR